MKKEKRGRKEEKIRRKQEKVENRTSWKEIPTRNRSKRKKHNIFVIQYLREEINWENLSPI